MGGKLGLDVGRCVGKLAFPVLNVGDAENNDFLLLLVGSIVGTLDGSAVGRPEGWLVG